MSITRRSLQQRAVAELRRHATELGLAATGRKSALVDRIYRAMRPTAQQQPQQPRGRTPPPQSTTAPTSDLAATVQEFVERSLQNAENRLLRLSHPPPPCAIDNISLPSQEPIPHQPCPPLDATVPPLDATVPLLGQQDPGEGGMDATTVTNLQKTPQLPVPVRVRQRIMKGEFIDFDGLLHDSLLPLRHSVSPSPSVSSRVMHEPSMAGEILIAQQRPANRRVVRDLSSSMEAWNIYITVVIAHYPARTLELLAYQCTICDVSSRFPAHCWLRYDASFRACAAADRSLRWDAKNNNLWLECFMQHASSQHESEHRPKSEKSVRRPCTYCGNLYHLPDNCSHNPFRSFRGADKWPTTSPRRPYTLHAPGGSYPATSVSATTRTSLNTKPFCKDFNVGECRRQHCRYLHACSRCSDTSHRERECGRIPNAPPRY